MSPPPYDETTLLTRARELDSRALGQIHDLYYPEIYRFARYRTGDDVAAEDIAGDVFLRLLDALHSDRAPRTTLRGWLFGVAAHLVADHFRRAPEEALSESLMTPNSVPADAEQLQRRGEVRAAVSGLTDEQQDVLALRFGDGFSVEQTAQALGKSVTAVKALQFRAVEALRKRLVEVGYE